MIVWPICGSIGIINQVILPSNLLYSLIKFIYKEKILETLPYTHSAVCWEINNLIHQRTILLLSHYRKMMPVLVNAMGLGSGQHGHEPWHLSRGEVPWLSKVVCVLTSKLQFLHLPNNGKTCSICLYWELNTILNIERLAEYPADNADSW